jgi:hypothetical protein
MKIFRAENSNIFGTRWVFALSRNSAKRIALATGMVKDEKNLTITEQPEETFKDTNAKEIDIEGVGHLYLVDGANKWFVYDSKEIFKRNSDRDVAANMSYGLNYLVSIDGKFNKIIEQLLENSIKDKEKEIKQAERDIVLKDLQEDEVYKRRWVLYFNSLESNLETEKQTLQEWRGKKAKSIEKQDAEKIFADI